MKEEVEYIDLGSGGMQILRATHGPIKCILVPTITYERTELGLKKLPQFSNWLHISDRDGILK